MYTRYWIKSACLLLMLLFAGCIDPYTPEVIEMPNNYLVVDGFINSNGQTTFTLSRTQNLTDDTPPPMEFGATVMVEEEQGPQTRLIEMGAGTYTAYVNVDPSRKYRLTIKTETGKMYASDYVTVKQTPPIDDVVWKAEGDEVRIYVNTHDPENNTRYYRWDYEGTYEYTAALYSDLKFDEFSNQVVYYSRNETNLYRCWRMLPSTTINIGTSGQLTNDVINESLIQVLPSSSEQLLIKYSILVKQYALTREGYQYWERLKKNTEGIGTLFDPLPTQLTGNIHSLSDPDEPVIGFIEASSVQEKRIFIDRKELPRDWWQNWPTCYQDTIQVNEAQKVLKQPSAYLPVAELYAENSPALIGYIIGSRRCVDCTVRGTNIKPDFWR